ncbi:MFS transporter [uncultured Corynebacterium sp.]|uniref:MFS transporter n=1 Tax=uncultured Corynebacterium sp. TaxID=159447 RepID=UPI0025E66C53|nr:MFS transporter [uncultured Corynebacterium sp.]
MPKFRPAASARSSHVRATLPAALLFLAVVAVSINLRAGIASVGPVLEETLAAFDADASVAGLLTSMPGFLFALLGLSAVPVALRLGLTRTVTIGAVLTFVGLAARPWVGAMWVFVVLTGLVVAGIAVANVLLPAWIKRHGGRHTVALMTVYGSLLGFSGAIGPLSALLADGPSSWKWALGLWAIPASLQVVVWLYVMVRIGDDAPRARRAATADEAGHPEGSHFESVHPDAAAAAEESADPAAAVPMRRSRTAVFLLMFFGLQSMNAYVQMGWLPQIYRDGGASATTGTVALALVGAFNVVGGLVMPALIARTRNLAPFTVVFALSTAVGYLGLLLADGHLPLLWAAFLGLGGFCFPTAIALIPDRSRSPLVTARLSGFVQPYGYLVAGAGPVVVGAVYGATGQWEGILVALVVAAMLMGLVGIRAAASTTIDDELADAVRR